jgi:Domain of Unknown Function (DUF1080)
MNNILKYCTLISLLFLSDTINAQTDTAPWKSLFNGKNFKGWKVTTRGKLAAAWVENGEMVGHSIVNTAQHTFIRSKKKYADFILEGDCKLDGDLHTGFLFRLIEAPDTATVSLYGYQVKIDPTTRKWTGGVFDDFGKTWHWLYTLKNDARAREAFKMQEWNTFRIEAIGNTIKVWVNNIPTVHLINNKYSKGYIALKIHSMGNTPEKEKILVHYKNIKILTKNLEKYRKETDLAALKAD